MTLVARRLLLVAAALTALPGTTADATRDARAAAGTAQANDSDTRDWIQLFNGKDLTGWTPKFAKHDLGENFQQHVRVENGLLEVRYDKWTKFDGEFGHVFYKDPFSYYVLAAEYRFVGEQVPGGPAWAIRNNGLMLHSPDPKTMLKDQDFPISIEVQLLGGLGDGKPRTTANLCTPGTNVVMNGTLHTRALHQLELEDLRRRPVGARGGGRSRRRAREAHGRGPDRAGVLEAADRRRRASRRSIRP